MHSRTVEQVRSWDSRPFDGGLEALSALSEDGHTGAVTAAHTWLFMLNGRVIGIFEGEIEDFEASGTVYSTAEDGLPLLFAMQERGGRTRAKYFTEDTSLQEADQTLSSANFTGYVELSENVLSGDYYLVYYGGTRREVAFVGQSERVETGETAYELAADEVGLYEVNDVSLTITEIPEPAAESQPTAAATAGQTEEAGTSATGTGDAATASSAGRAAADSTDDQDQSSEMASAPDKSTESASSAETQPADGSPPTSDTPDEAASSGAASSSRSASTADERDAAERNETSASSTPARETAADPSAPEQQSSDAARQERQQRNAAAGQRREGTPDEQEAVAEAETAEGPSGTAGASSDERDTDASELERRFREEAEWRQTRAIPALDPDATHPTDGESDQPTPAEQPAEPPETRQAPDAQTARSTPSTTQDAPRSQVEKLQVAVKKREARIEELQSRIQSLESERSELQSDLEETRASRESLEADLETVGEEREELAARVGELEAGADTSQAGETRSPDAALAGTNLFVRYDSKGEPTLEALGEADPEAIDANLRLEHHTQFETDAVTVDGQPFREFLESTGTFAVLSWLLREFPYELLETDNQSAMSALFEAISAIDRIELDGDVTVDAEAGRTETFSFVLRDRMGNPLIVGEYDDSRDAVRESKLQDLLSGAEAVAGVSEQFAGALYVTKSFFEPGALELAENSASSGGLFSRGEKASYVSPADGTGFHLALVEDRSQSFHVTVPKL